MPLYEYQCTHCCRIYEKYFSIAEKPAEIDCPDCGRKAASIISASSNRREWDEYWDENLGDKPVLVTSRAHREKLKRERGLTDQYHHKRGHKGQWV